MNQRPWKVALLLYGSGTCALIYQVAWLREFRLVFGASTAASAAVLAIFMGGLGVGGLLLGRRADRHPKPLRFYGQLELLIALSAAITPGLIWLIRHLYVALGGSVSLGLFGATVVRLILSALVLSIPTILMGGTLPAAVKSIETEDDVARRRLAILYGANTLGAVTGALLSTFLMLEVLGAHKTLWLACLVNSIVGVLAWQLAGAAAPGSTKPLKPADSPRREAVTRVAAPATARDEPHALTWPRFVLLSAGIAGFAFFLMELVWYRMLSPLLGGTTYTFGLILAVALLGIGLGGGAYGVFGRRRLATVSGLAITCALEAFFIAVPFALGDQLALLAALLRSLGTLGFTGHLIGWSIVTSIVVLPVAIVAGVQFPLLIALLGHGSHDVGQHTGAAYAWNTGGAIFGSLAGGFGLLPLLSAPGTWRAVVILLVALSAAAAMRSRYTEQRLLSLVPSMLASLVALGLLFTTGPTAAWRHSAIGAGRAKIGTTRNEARDWMQTRRRVVQWETEGVESSIGLTDANGLSLLNNGKSDGNVKLDASTFVMVGITGAILHPQPRNGLVIGLGTGTTVGWLAAIPSMDRVDVVELESATIEVARRCSKANLSVLDNSKVHLAIGDAREVLLASSQEYDLIISQPSNPYRAGVANLFTRDYYEAIQARLKDGGNLLQWVQAYDIDVRTLASIYATLRSVFPVVETWQTVPDDLLLICSMNPISYDVPSLRKRIQEEPYKSALLSTWRTTDLEGFLAHFVARTALAESLARRVGVRINTDDRNPLEYAFARTVGQDYVWTLDELRKVAQTGNADRPDATGGAVDWDRLRDRQITMCTADEYAPLIDDRLTPDQRQRAEVQLSFLKGNMAGVLEAWKSQTQEPASPMELIAVSYALADQGNEAARTYADQLGQIMPVEAAIVRAHLCMKQGKLEDAAKALTGVFERLRSDPWPLTILVNRSLKDASALAAQDKTLAPRLLQAIREPFAVYILNDERIFSMVSIAARIGLSASVAAIQAYEPNVPWSREFLIRRLEWYQAANDPKAAIARRDLEEFLQYEPTKLLDAGASVSK